MTVIAPDVTSGSFTITDLTAAYLAYRERYQADPATIQRMRPVLDDFADWAGLGDPDSITGQQIDGGYLADWDARFQARRGRPPAIHSTARHISTLRIFWKWAHEMGHVRQNPMGLVKPPRVPPQRINWLREDEERELLASVKTEQETIVVNLLRFTGMRAGEACDLLNHDVVMAQSSEYPWGYIRIRESKTPTGERIIPIFPELRPFIWQWQARQMLRGLGGDKHFFLATRNGTALSRRDMWRVVERVGRRAGVKCSPHTLRRTFGSSILNRDWTKLTPVSAALGHRNTAVTQRAYAALEQATVARALLS